MIKWWNRKEGFTLVELLVVIAIIGILATLLILQLGVARQRARDAQRITHINQIRTALEFHFDSEGQYPDVIYAAAGTVGPLDKYLSGGVVPIDPSKDGQTANGKYGYSKIDNLHYHLFAELEQKATALNSDLDYIATHLETCEDTLLTNNNCVYDVGQTN